MQYRLTITSADAIGEPQVNLLTAGDLIDQCPWTATLIGEYFHMDLYIGLEHFCIEPVPEQCDLKDDPGPEDTPSPSNRSLKRELATISYHARSPALRRAASPSWVAQLSVGMNPPQEGTGRILDCNNSNCNTRIM